MWFRNWRLTAAMALTSHELPMPLQNASNSQSMRSGSLSSNAQSVPVVRVALAEDAPAKDTIGLSCGVLAGTDVGSVLGGIVLIFLIGLLILCLCQRRKISSDQTKPGTNSG